MADKTLVALFANESEAQTTLSDLENAGIDRRNVTVTSHGDYGTRGAAGLLSMLNSRGVPEQDAHGYAEGVRRGGTLLALDLPADQVDRAMSVLERGNPIDIDERRESWRQSGWTGFDTGAAPYDETSIAEERQRYASRDVDTDARLGDAAAGMRDANLRREDLTEEREEVIPVSEERLNIGKRAVEHGGVRVRSYVVETPIEEQVTLRDESVTVERRPVDPNAPVGEEGFQERTIEVTETDEVPVVGKQAFVKEEVVIRKGVEQRTETVRDTVRRTEVEVEKDRAAQTRKDVPPGRDNT
ncbi:MAG TPA: YsnF/AvaK domain-containing protein [Azospirillaceae bacterium]|nr:YsnF/AvaK domain-containing protein [Azospirillaceae bacterium]